MFLHIVNMPFHKERGMFFYFDYHFNIKGRKRKWIIRVFERKKKDWLANGPSCAILGMFQYFGIAIEGQYKRENARKKEGV